MQPELCLILFSRINHACEQAIDDYHKIIDLEPGILDCIKNMDNHEKVLNLLDEVWLSHQFFAILIITISWMPSVTTLLKKVVFRWWNKGK